MRETYPAAYADLLKCGMTTLTVHDPDYVEGEHDPDDDDPGVLEREELFDTTTLGRDVIPSKLSVGLVGVGEGEGEGGGKGGGVRLI